MRVENTYTEQQGNDLAMRMVVKADCQGKVSTSWMRNSQSNQNSKNNGYITKTYSWTRGTKKTVRAKTAAISYCAKSRGNTLWFVTLTSVDQVNNTAVSKLVENLKKRGVIINYVWVRELQKRGVNHWHMLFESQHKLQDYKLWRNAWNSALKSEGATPSSNSVRWGKKPRVYGNPNRVVNYLCKYMTKGKVEAAVNGIRPETPEKFTERVTHSSRIKYTGHVTLSDLIAQEIFPHTASKNDWSACYYFSPDEKYLAVLYGLWAAEVKQKQPYSNNFNLCLN